MRTFLAVLMFLLKLAPVFSQWNCEIRGQVSDVESGEMIPFASISLLKGGSSMPGGAVSNTEGNFEISRIQPGTYDVIVSFIGYRSDTLKNILLSREEPVADLGRVPLRVSAVDLEEVEVTAMAATVQTHLDRKTYRAEDFETARGGTAVDLLNRLPSISVSPDGEVSVRGTTDFMLYVNGKPTQTDPAMVLGQIAGSNIENIEVISVPTARYDAQGKGGIINIRTRTPGLQGLSVTANATAGDAPWGHSTDRYSGYGMTDLRYGGGLNLSYGKGNISLYGGIQYNFRNVNGERTGDARILDALSGAYKHMVAGGERPEWYEYYSVTAGLGYRLTDATTLSASYFYGNRTEGRSAFYVYHTFYGDEDKAPVSGVPVQEGWIYNPNTDNRYGTFHTADLELNHIIGDRANLDISLLFEHSGLSRQLDNYNYEYLPETAATGEISDHYLQTDNTPLNAFRFSMDYSTELPNGQRLGVGFQPQYLSISGDFSYDTLEVTSQRMGSYTGLENGISLGRGIYAGYVDYTGSWDRFELSAGLRLEYTDQKMDIDNPDYFTIFDRPTKGSYTVRQMDWFPTLHAGYSLLKNTTISLAASRRISRPPVKNMTPFLYRRHLEVYVVGDPALKPEYTSVAELDLKQKLGKQEISLTGFYRGVDNAIFRVNTVYPQEMVLIRSYTNSGNTKALGAELNADLEAGTRAKFFLGGSLYNYRVQGDIFGYREDNSGTNWSLKWSTNINFSRQLKFTMDFDMISATVTAQGSNDLFFFTNTALSYTPGVLKRWSFVIRILDVLSSNVQGLDTRAYDAEGQQIFYQETVYTRMGPIAELGISYSFNSDAKKGKKADSAFGKNEF